MIFFLHFLMMTATLLSLSTFHEISHALEYFICSTKVLQYKMTVMNLQKEVIQPTLLFSPMTLLDILRFPIYRLVLWSSSTLRWFLSILFFTQLDVTFLAEKRLVVVSRNHLLLLIIWRVRITWQWAWIREGCCLVNEGLVRIGGSIYTALYERNLFGLFGSLFLLTFRQHELLWYLECLWSNY